MSGWSGLSRLSLALVAAAAVASPAFAHHPQTAAPAPAPASPAPTPTAEDAVGEIIIACLRLPTLADLSKERWNETHRRFDGRRGRPIRRA